MNITSANLNLLVALHVLLEERSVTRAAKRCGITQSSMSYSLARLREMFDDALLVRRGGTLVPTPVALALMPRLGSALADLRLILQKQPERFDPSRSERRFRLASSDMFQLVALPKLLCELARTAPRVEVALRALSEASFDHLASGALELIIEGSTPSPPPGIRMRALFRQDYVCIVRRGHPRVSGRLSLSTFCALGHVLVAQDEAPGLVDRALEPLGRARRVSVRIPDYAAIGHVIANTDLIATVPRLVADTLARSSPLQVVKPPLRLRGFGVCVYWHERYDTDPGLQWFRDVLCALAP